MSKVAFIIDMIVYWKVRVALFFINFSNRIFVFIHEYMNSRTFRVDALLIGNLGVFSFTFCIYCFFKSNITPLFMIISNQLL